MTTSLNSINGVAPYNGRHGVSPGRKRTVASIHAIRAFGEVAYISTHSSFGHEVRLVKFTP
jgi:hypothetical protein